MVYDEAEAIRFALMEFLNRHYLQLMEQFQTRRHCLGIETKGGKRVRKVVANTSPVLHLREAQAIHFTVEFSEVFAPEAVQAELCLLLPKEALKSLCKG